MLSPLIPSRPQAPAAPARPSLSTLVDGRPNPGGSVDRITLKEAGGIAMAGVAGGALASLGGVSVATLGPWVGVPAALLGCGLAGAAVGYALTAGHHDGSVTGGMLMAGGIAGAVGGTLGSLAGAAVSAAGGNPIVGGAVAGALVAGGFATYLALGN